MDGDLNIFIYDEKESEPRKFDFYLEQNMTAAEDPKNNAPRDIVMIMSKKWLVVARPTPTRSQENLSQQAHHIWRQVQILLDDDVSRQAVDTICCWVFYFPGNTTTKIQDGKIANRTWNVLEVYAHVFEAGMRGMPFVLNQVFGTRDYPLGKDPEGNQKTKHSCKIVVQDLETLEKTKSLLKLKDEDYVACTESDYGEHLFPPVLLVPQFTRRGEKKTETDLENVQLVYSHRELRKQSA